MLHKLHIENRKLYLLFLGGWVQWDKGGCISIVSQIHFLTLVYREKGNEMTCNENESKGLS